MKNVLVAPSLLAADKNKFIEEIKLCELNGASFVHIDVMDGKFVPNTSFTDQEVKIICDNSKLVHDVHIMIFEPLKYTEKFLELGADYLTFHVEACSNEEAYKIIELVHSKNKKVGISVKPKTSINDIKEFLDRVDMVLVMTVEPGFGGQKFMEDCSDKIKELDILRKEFGYKYIVEVDGGINHDTGLICKNKGVDVLVAGSYLFGHEDFKERVEGLK